MEASKEQLQRLCDWWFDGVRLLIIYLDGVKR